MKSRPLLTASALSVLLTACAGRPSADPEVTLQCIPSPPGTKAPFLRFEGSGPFPDGTILRISIARGEEAHEAGRFDLRYAEAGRGFCETTIRRFSYKCSIDRRGPYRGTVTLMDDDQRPSVPRDLAGRFPVRRWQFEFNLWEDDLLSRLDPEQEKVESLAAEARRIYDRAQTASESRESWTAWGAEIRRQAQHFWNQIEQIRWASLYPASLLDLRAAVSWIVWNSEHFFWQPDGAFGGAFDVREGRWARTPSGAPFSFGEMRGTLDQAIELARREHDLWTVKDARRAGRRLPSGEDLAKLEELLRGERRERSGLPEPPPPAQFADVLAARASQENRLVEAMKLLEEADRRWNQPGRESFAIYQRLLKDYPVELERLQVRGRVERRAQMDEE